MKRNVMSITGMEFPIPIRNGSNDVSCTIDVSTVFHKKMDFIERTIAKELPVGCVSIESTFLEGLYIRKMSAKAGIIVTSKIHKERHPFSMTKGKIKLFDGENGWRTVSAPFSGLTEVGSRRMALVLEDMVWYTFHATTSTDIDEIESQVIFAHDSGALELQKRHIEGGSK